MMGAGRLAPVGLQVSQLVADSNRKRGFCPARLRVSAGTSWLTCSDRAMQPSYLNMQKF